MLPPILSCALGGYSIGIGNVVLWLWISICLYVLFWRLLWFGLVFNIWDPFGCWCLWVRCVLALVVGGGGCGLWLGHMRIIFVFVPRLL